MVENTRLTAVFWATERLDLILSTTSSVDNRACAEEIKPSIAEFLKKLKAEQERWDNEYVFKTVTNVVTAVTNLACNTRCYEKLNDEEIEFLDKTLQELYAIYDESIKDGLSDEQRLSLKAKTKCINHILCFNMAGMNDTTEIHDNYRDGMIFQSYENIWKIVHRLNVEWDELQSRGFTNKIFMLFQEELRYEKHINYIASEAEKIQRFMELLDGRAKFVPMYKCTLVCHKLVHSDFKSKSVILGGTAENDECYGLTEKETK